MPQVFALFADDEDRPQNMQVRQRRRLPVTARSSESKVCSEHLPKHSTELFEFFAKTLKFVCPKLFPKCLAPPFQGRFARAGSSNLGAFLAV